MRQRCAVIICAGAFDLSLVCVTVADPADGDVVLILDKDQFVFDLENTLRDRLLLALSDMASHRHILISLADKHTPESAGPHCLQHLALFATSSTAAMFAQASSCRIPRHLRSHKRAPIDQHNLEEPFRSGSAACASLVGGASRLVPNTIGRGEEDALSSQQVIAVLCTAACAVLLQHDSRNI